MAARANPYFYLKEKAEGKRAPGFQFDLRTQIDGVT